MIDSRLSGGTVTAAFDVHEDPKLPIVHDNEVSALLTRKVKLRAELLLTKAVRLTARLVAVRVTFGYSIETLSSSAFDTEVPDGEP